MQICRETLVALFYDDPDALGAFEEVTDRDMPPTPRSLLAHNDHMTVTIEAFHDSSVDVHVLTEHCDQDHYAREILLTRQSDDQVVQYGIMRINLRYVDADVRCEIQSRQTPLGRILIEHNVLRKVQLQSLWKIRASEHLARHLAIEPGQAVHGRTALIYCNGEPAIELLEIVTPVDEVPA